MLESETAAVSSLRLLVTARVLKVGKMLYQSSIILNHYEGLKLTLASLKISYLEQLNSKIFALLSTSFPCLKIDHFIKSIGIKNKFQTKKCHLSVALHTGLFLLLDRNALLPTSHFVTF